MRCFCRVEYDGSDYGGWQVQENARSVQGQLEEAFATVVRTPCAVVGAGRTDAGVHARGQGMHADLPDDIDVRECERSVNGVLPVDIAVRDLVKVDPVFHARFLATERCYSYYLVSRKTPLWHGRALLVSCAVDWDLVEREMHSLVGTHDFTAFCASGSGALTRECEVRRAEIRSEREIHVVTIAANRFLYKMVRGIVGTLVDIGRGEITRPLAEIIAARDRSRIGNVAPARGLVLEYVDYPEKTLCVESAAG